MNFDEFQKLFSEAWRGINQKKTVVVYLLLSLCGLFVVLSKIIALTSNDWVTLSLSFAPLFFCGALLLALGVFIIKCNIAETAKIKVSYLKIALDSIRAYVPISYVLLPMLSLSLISWFILGTFFLLKKMPFIGDYIGLFLSFAPFILVLLALVVIFLNLTLLFFLTPDLAMRKTANRGTWKRVIALVALNPLLSALSFGAALLPFLFALSFLIPASILSQTIVASSQNPVLQSLKWLFYMLFFNIAFSPLTIFFFSFAQLWHKKRVLDYKEVASPSP